MFKNSGVLVTTTAIQDAIQLENYRGIVSARVVTGVDLFSDMFAGLSDVFGGRSATYQKQLKSIYDEVMSQLEDEAKRIGANAIVGVSIDHDEISGKGKQMFMVTAIGTAAYIPEYSIEKEIAATRSDVEISLDKYEHEYKRLSTIYQVNQDFNHIHSHWPTILELYPTEIMGQVFKLYDSTEIDYNHSKADVYRYFAGLDEAVAKAFLYNQLPTNGKALTILKQAKLTDYDYIEKLLTDEHGFAVKKFAVQLLTEEKRNYRAEDIAKLEKLVPLLASTFKLRARHEADRWICECGKVNKSAAAYCKSCDQDDRGFKKDDVDPKGATAKLKERVYVLKSIYGQR